MLLWTIGDLDRLLLGANPLSDSRFTAAMSCSMRSSALEAGSEARPPCGSDDRTSTQDFIDDPMLCRGLGTTGVGTVKPGGGGALAIVGRGLLAERTAGGPADALALASSSSNMSSALFVSMDAPFGFDTPDLVSAAGSGGSPP